MQTTERVAERFTQSLARLLIRLQSASLQQLIEQAQVFRTQLDDVLGPVIGQSSSAWTEAGTEAAHYLETILKVNKDMPLSETLSRPDVLQALQVPFQEAGTSTIQHVQQAWDHGLENGLAHANASLNILGQHPVTMPEIDTALRDSLVNDVQANIQSATEKFIHAIQSGDRDTIVSELQNLTNNLAMRSRYSTFVAGQNGANEAQEAAYAKAMKDQGITLRKVWVTRFGPGTCAECALLHGEIRDLGEAFTPGKLAVYGGQLQHPPRHPNCRCRIVVYVEDMAEEPGTSLATMKQYGKGWIKNVGLARVWVPPHESVSRLGHPYHVKGFWRDDGKAAVPDGDALKGFQVEAVQSIPPPNSKAATTSVVNVMDGSTPVGTLDVVHRSDGMAVRSVLVARHYQHRGIAVAMAKTLHEALPNEPVIHGGFASWEGLAYGVYMASHYPEWNKIWLGRDEGWWKAGDPPAKLMPTILIPYVEAKMLMQVVQHAEGR